MIKSLPPITHQLHYVVLIHLIVRVLVALLLDLGVDEAYYFSYAKYLDWSYYDHPPLVGWLIRLTTFNLLWVNDLLVRLSSLLVGIINVYLIYIIGYELKNKTAAMGATILYIASFYTSILTGIFILPDTPLSIFWLMGLLFFIRFIRTHRSNWIYLFGFAIGLGLLSKYQSLFLWLGASIYLLIYEPKIFIKKEYWISLFILLLVFSPVLLWNIYSSFSGLSYHVSRIDEQGGYFFVLHGIKHIVLEFVYHNPFNILCIVTAFLLAIKQKLYNDRVVIFLFLSSIPLIACVWGLSFFSDSTLPHWSGPAYTCLIICAAFIHATCLEREGYFKRLKKIFRYSQLMSIILFFVMMALIIIIFPSNLMPSHDNMDNPKLGEFNFITDMTVWDEVSVALDKFMQEQQIDSPIMVMDGWILASRISYYYTYPKHLMLFVLGDNHFYHKTNLINGKMLPLGADLYYIHTSNYYSEPSFSLQEKFEHVMLQKKISIFESGIKKIKLYVIKMEGLKEPLF